MCGRYAASKDAATLIEEFDISRAPEAELPPDYNVAPTKDVYTVLDRPRREDDVDAQGRSSTGGGGARGGASGSDAPEEYERSLEIARWGLVPSWAKDPKIGNRMINARVETAAEKPSFRRAWKSRRCLLPADGFYEWYTPTSPDAPVGKSGKPLKQPYFIHLPDGQSLAMAGLYEWWKNPEAPADEDPWLLTVTILTTTATDAIGRLHDRMPIHVAAADREAWLDPANPEPATVLHPEQTAEMLQAYPVSTAVNRVGTNSPHLIDPLPPS